MLRRDVVRQDWFTHSHVGDERMALSIVCDRGANLGTRVCKRETGWKTHSHPPLCRLTWREVGCAIASWPLAQRARTRVFSHLIRRLGCSCRTAHCPQHQTHTLAALRFGSKTKVKWVFARKSVDRSNRQMCRPGHNPLGSHADAQGKQRRTTQVKPPRALRETWNGRAPKRTGVAKSTQMKRFDSSELMKTMYFSFTHTHSLAPTLNTLSLYVLLSLTPIHTVHCSLGSVVAALASCERGGER